MAGRALEHRVTDLERASAPFAGPLLILVDGEPTEAQLLAMEEAARIGRTVLQMSLLDERL